MSKNSTPRPPLLEKLLLDADVDPRIEPLLRAVRFRIRSVHRTKVDVGNDAAIVRWAREHGYFVLCHDRHRDFPTRLELFPEVAYHGGQVIQVGSDDARDPHTTVGQLLAWRAEWRKWFDDHRHGIVYVHAQGFKTYTQQRLAAMVPNVMDLDETGENVRRRQSISAKRRKRLPKNQPELRLPILGDQGADEPPSEVGP